MVYKPESVSAPGSTSVAIVVIFGGLPEADGSAGFQKQGSVSAPRSTSVAIGIIVSEGRRGLRKSSGEVDEI